MAAQQMVDFGVPTAITQTTIYSLPGTKVMHITSDTAVEVSVTTTTTSFSTLTNANTVGANCSAAFIRCTTTTANIIVRQY